MPILVFLGLSVLELGPTYATRRQTSDRRQTKASLNASAVWERRHNKRCIQVILQYLNCLPFDADFDVKQYLFLTNYSTVVMVFCMNFFTCLAVISLKKYDIINVCSLASVCKAVFCK